jgi:hypothetical protein
MRLSDWLLPMIRANTLARIIGGKKVSNICHTLERVV